MISIDDKEFVYDVLTSNGPDVNMWSQAFGRLVGRAKKAGVIGNRKACYDWLDRLGYFGRKSDSLRADGDKYY